MASYLCIALAFVAACSAYPQVSTYKPDFRNAVCQHKNAYYKVEASCDSYVECTGFVAVEMSCPDGLHYNPEAQWPEYPCGYPSDVPCEGRGPAQAAKPTADCPHQYGFFASPAATPDNCGQYRMCVASKAVEMVCPAGLAFNPATGRCDWPDQVATCDANQFLGFSCPAVPTDAVIVNYKYPGNCYHFFSCETGRARLLACDEGLAFDQASGRCVDADYVNCEATRVAVENA